MIFKGGKQIETSKSEYMGHSEDIYLIQLPSSDKKNDMGLKIPKKENLSFIYNANLSGRKSLNAHVIYVPIIS